MKAMQVPGVSIYVSTPKMGEWQAALGTADVAQGTASQVADHFRIGNYTTTPFLNALADNPQKVWAPQSLASLGASMPPSFPAGSKMEYSNTNYILLGQIAEKVSGEPFEQLLQKRVFDPLAMTGCSQSAATEPHGGPGRKRSG